MSCWKRAQSGCPWMWCGRTERGGGRDRTRTWQRVRRPAWVGHRTRSSGYRTADRKGRHLPQEDSYRSGLQRRGGSSAARARPGRRSTAARHRRLRASRRPGRPEHRPRDDHRVRRDRRAPGRTARPVSRRAVPPLRRSGDHPGPVRHRVAARTGPDRRRPVLPRRLEGVRRRRARTRPALPLPVTGDGPRGGQPPARRVDSAAHGPQGHGHQPPGTHPRPRGRRPQHGHRPHGARDAGHSRHLPGPAPSAMPAGAGKPPRRSAARKTSPSARTTSPPRTGRPSTPHLRPRSAATRGRPSKSCATTATRSSTTPRPPGFTTPVPPASTASSACPWPTREASRPHKATWSRHAAPGTGP
jgi:hypothetical protein